jgi:hypothetical protein
MRGLHSSSSAADLLNIGKRGVERARIFLVPKEKARPKPRQKVERYAPRTLRRAVLTVKPCSQKERPAFPPAKVDAFQASSTLRGPVLLVKPQSHQHHAQPLMHIPLRLSSLGFCYRSDLVRAAATLPLS